MPSCPICNKNLYDFSTLIRHVKTHKTLLAKAMTNQECNEACENQCPLVWQWNAKKSARQLCLCTVCGKGAHCFREKKVNFVVETGHDENGKNKNVQVGIADKFYKEHQFVCKSKFNEVAHLFDLSKKKPTRTRAKSIKKDKQIVAIPRKTLSSSVSNSVSEIKESIANRFDSIFDRYAYQTDEDEDEEELLECRVQRTKQRSLTVLEMIKEIDTVYIKLQKNIRAAKEAGKREVTNIFSLENKELTKDVSALQNHLTEKNNSLFLLQEELRESKKINKGLRERIDELGQSPEN